MKSLYNYLFKLVASASRKINDKWFRGIPKESLSGRSYRLHESHIGWRISRHLINLLFFWQPDHCKVIHLSEIAKGI